MKRRKKYVTEDVTTQECALQFLQHEWLQASFRKTSDAKYVEAFIDLLEAHSQTLLHKVVNMCDQNVCVNLPNQHFCDYSFKTEPTNRTTLHCTMPFRMETSTWSVCCWTARFATSTSPTRPVTRRSCWPLCAQPRTRLIRWSCDACSRWAMWT